MRIFLGLLALLFAGALHAQTISPPSGSGSGSGTVSSCSTVGGVAFYASSGTTVGCSTGVTASNTALTLGSGGTLATNPSATNPYNFLTLTTGDSNTPSNFYIAQCGATNVGATRDDESISLGYNYSSCGRVNNSDIAAAWVIEDFYQPGSTPQVEMYTQYYSTGGVSRRPIFITIPNNTNSAGINLQGSGVSFLADDGVTSYATIASPTSTVATNFHLGGNTVIDVNQTLGWNAVAGAGSGPDTGFSRDSAGVVDLGTGSNGSKAGALNLTSLTAQPTGVITTPDTSTFDNFGQHQLTGSPITPTATSDASIIFGFGAAQAVTVTAASPAVVSLTAHGFVAGQAVTFNATTMPNGLSASTPYFVMSAGLSANAFQVSATLNGSAINTTTTGTSVKVTSGVAWLSNNKSSNGPGLLMPLGASIGSSSFSNQLSGMFITSSGRTQLFAGGFNGFQMTSNNSTISGSADYPLYLNSTTTNGSGTWGQGLNITGTLNTTGVVDGAALFANLTNTASGAGSTLIDLQIGSASAFNITMGKLVQLPAITSDATHTDATICEDTTTHALYSGSGTLGICLGTSSARYKHDIAALNAGLSEIMALRPVSYYLNSDHGDPSKLLYGFTAEDGAKALPDLTGVDKNGLPNTFDYLGVVPVLVRAIQQQQLEIESLKRKFRR